MMEVKSKSQNKGKVWMYQYYHLLPMLNLFQKIISQGNYHLLSEQKIHFIKVIYVQQMLRLKNVILYVKHVQIKVQIFFLNYVNKDVKEVHILCLIFLQVKMIIVVKRVLIVLIIYIIIILIMKYVIYHVQLVIMAQNIIA